MNRLFALSKYVKYRLYAGSANDVHSPFVFELFTNVIKDQVPFYGYDDIESLRSQHLLDDRKINITDFGTGKNNREERICNVAKKALKSKKYAQLLFRLSNTFQPSNVLEMGTSLGITSLYLALPIKKGKIITLEGCPEIAAIAQKNFNKLKCKNVELITGEFEKTLPISLDKLQRVDLVFFDGNHSHEATISYFQKCLDYSTENSVFIFDDIHWSPGMEKAWEEIKENNSVSISVDLYQLGIVFFRKGVTKQHFMLRF